MAFKDLKIKNEDFKDKNIQSIESDTVIGKADELKRLFDAPAQEVLKEKINALIDYLMTTTAGEEIGTPEISDGSGRTIADQFKYLFEEMQAISAGSVADGSIEDIKLSDKDGQIKDVVSVLSHYFATVKDYGLHNSLISWIHVLNEDGEDLRLDSVPISRGACYFPYGDGGDGAARFGTLPLECGGTNNDALAEAADGVYIVKKTSSNGEAYLGYLTASQVMNALGAVPKTRTVNGKALSANITLGASDVSAVPTTRTVNGKALSANITLSANDVGAMASGLGTRIPAGANMNSYTEAGVYYVSSNDDAASISNLATVAACRIEIKAVGVTIFQYQICLGEACATYVRRGYNSNGTWSFGSWHKEVRADTSQSTSVTGTTFNTIAASPYATLRHNPVVGACFLRMECTVTGSNITKGSWKTIATIPSGYRPSAIYALSVGCPLTLNARVNESGSVQIMGIDTPTSGTSYAIYISGFWML